MEITVRYSETNSIFPNDAGRTECHVRPNFTCVNFEHIKVPWYCGLSCSFENNPPFIMTAITNSELSQHFALCSAGFHTLAVTIFFTSFCRWGKWGAESAIRITLLINGELDFWHQCKIELSNPDKYQYIPSMSNGAGAFKNGLGKVRDSYHIAVLRMNNHLSLSTKMMY